MPKLPPDAPTSFPAGSERAQAEETTARVMAWLEQNQPADAAIPAAPAAPAVPEAPEAEAPQPPKAEILAPVEVAPPAPRAPAGMAALHEYDDRIREESVKKGVQNEQELKSLAGVSERPGMGELRMKEYRDEPKAEAVKSLVEERNKLPEGSERRKEIDTELGAGKEAWKTEEETSKLRGGTPFGMAFKLMAPSLDIGSASSQSAIQKKVRAESGVAQQENALKLYAARDEARRFSDRLGIPAGEVPISLAVSPEGDIEVDARPYKDRMAFSQRDVLAKEAGYSSWSDVAEEVARNNGYRDYVSAPDPVKKMAQATQSKFQKDAEEWAQREIVRAGQVGRHLTFVDLDPEHTSEKIAALPMGLREAAAVLTPEAAISMSPKAAEFQPSSRGAYVWHVLNMIPATVAAHEMAYEKIMPDFSRPWSEWASGLLQSQTASTPEESLALVRDIRSNPMIAQHFAEMSGKAVENALTSDQAIKDGYTKDDAKKYAAWARFAGGAFGFLTGDLVMPDPITMTLSTAGLGFKVAGKAAKEADYAWQANELRNAAAESNLDYSQFIDRIRSNDPVTADILEMRISQEFQMKTSIRAAIREAEETAQSAAKRAEELRAKANVNPGDEALHAEAAQAEAEDAIEQASLASKRRIATEEALRNFEDSNRAQAKVAEKTWKDWTAAKKKAEEASKAYDEWARSSGTAVAEHGSAQSTFVDAGVAAEKANVEKKAAQAAKTEAVNAAKEQLSKARAELDAAIKAKDSSGKLSAASKVQEAKNVIAALGKADHPLNAAIKTATEELSSAVAVRERAKVAAMGADTAHGATIAQGKKLENAAVKAADRQARLEGLARLSGVDLSSGVHPATQVLNNLENAVSGAKVAEAAALKKVKNASDVVGHAERMMDAAIREAETAERAVGWRETATKMADDMEKGIKEYQKWSEAPTRYEDIIKPSVSGVEEGKVMVKSEPFIESLVKKYGQDAVDHAMTERGPFGEVLRKIEMGSSAPATGLTQQELEILQDHPTFMTMAKRRSGPNAASSALVEAMEISKKMDASIKPKSTMKKMLKTASDLYDSMYPKDTLITSIGPSKAMVQEVIKGTTNLSAQFDDEFLTIVRKARLQDLDYGIVKQVVERFGFNPDIAEVAGTPGWSPSKITGQLFYTEEERAVAQISAIIQYMDSTKGLEYVGGKTFINTTSAETTWQIARRKMVFGDARSRAWNEAMDEWERTCVAMETDYREALAAYEEQGANYATTRGPRGAVQPTRTEPLPAATYDPEVTEVTTPDRTVSDRTVSDLTDPGVTVSDRTVPDLTVPDRTVAERTAADITEEATQAEATAATEAMPPRTQTPERPIRISPTPMEEGQLAKRPEPPVFPPAPHLGPAEGETLSPIVTLSRSWLPAFTTVDANVAANLESKAIEALRENMKNEGTFLDMMVRLRGNVRRPTGIGMGESEYAVSRAIGFAARGAAHGRVLSTGDDLLYRAIGGLLDRNQVRDMNLFVQNRWSEVENFNHMLDGFNRMGIPITQVAPKGVESSGKITELNMRLIETGKDLSGNSLFMGQNLISKIEENLPKVTKELQKRAASARLPEQILGAQAEQWFVGQWKKSLITGTIIPNMHYWAANIAGDFSQMWFTPGVGPFTSAKQSFNNLPANIPGIGPVFQDFMSEMSYRAQGKPVLGTLTNAFFNPLLSRFWNGGEGIVKFRSGMDVSFETLRKWAVEDGILDTFLHEELPDAFTRVTPKFWQRAMSGWSDHITQFANFAQQRQRSGLYLELLQQGYTRNEAKRLTLDALYDWKHAIAQHELRGFAKNIPFYRFFRLQQRQVFSAFTDCFVKPEESFVLALGGQSKLGAARSQKTLTELISSSQSWLNPEMQAPYDNNQAQRDAMQPLLRPSWMRDRGVFYVDQNKDEYVRALQNVSGKAYTHSATTQLPLTAVDGMTMQFGFLESMAAIAAPKEMLAPDWEESFWEPTLNVLAPYVREPVRAFIEAYGVDSGGIKPGSTAKVTPGEAEVMNLLSRSGLMDEVVQDSKTGELRAPSLQAFMFRMIPIAGSEAPKFLDSTMWNNPATMVYRDKLKRAARYRDLAGYSSDAHERMTYLLKASELENEAPHEVGAMYSWFLRKQLGVGPALFNPKEEVERRIQSIKESYKQMEGEIEKPPFAGYAPPESER